MRLKREVQPRIVLELQRSLHAIASAANDNERGHEADYLELVSKLVRCPYLAVLSFKGLTLGAHVVTLDLGVLDQASFSAEIFEPIHYSTQFTINVTAVPEPATYALLLGGLAVIGALARRRAHQA